MAIGYYSIVYSQLHFHGKFWLNKALVNSAGKLVSSHIIVNQVNTLNHKVLYFSKQLRELKLAT